MPNARTSFPRCAAGRMVTGCRWQLSRPSHPRYAKDCRPRGTFPDAPFVTNQTDLSMMSSAEPRQVFVSQMDKSFVVRHVVGTALFCFSGVLAAMRLPCTLCDKAKLSFREGAAILRQHRDPCLRGDGTMNVSKGFHATGFKNGLCEQIAMPHTGYATTEGALQSMHAFMKIKATYEEFVHPQVLRYASSQFCGVLHWLSEHDVLLYVKQVTSCTIGELFWPVSHVDKDLWYTVLVALDRGAGVVAGGDFAFPTLGWVLKLCDGDILIYNPTIHHGTTEFHVDSTSNSRLMLAFYFSKNAFRGACNVKAIYDRVGLRRM